MARPTSPHGSPHGPLHDSLHSNLHCGAGRGGGRGAGRGAAATPAARRAMEFAGGAGDADGLLVSDIPFGIHVVAVYYTEAVFRLEEPVLQGRPVDEHGPDFTLTVTIARWGGSIISEGRRVNWRLLRSCSRATPHIGGTACATRACALPFPFARRRIQIGIALLVACAAPARPRTGWRVFRGLCGFESTRAPRQPPD